ncbi:MAG: hypothetical protein PVH19_11910 [Planctomycetia bacterium]|jgi:prepilin-type processing-associated H-X9-DG protein
MSEPVRYRVYPTWMFGVALTFGVLAGVLFCNERLPQAYCRSGSDYFILFGSWLGCVFVLIRLFRIRRLRFSELFTCIGVGTVLLFLMMPNIEAGRMAARWGTDSCQLRAIGAALHAYHEKHGQFPPLATLESEEELVGTSRNGDPVHYLAVTGEGTAWGTAGKTGRLSEIRDPAHTAIVIGVVDPGPLSEKTKTVPLEDLVSGNIAWEKQAATYPYQQDLFSTIHPGVNVLMADGSVRFCIGRPTPEEIRELFSIHDKTPIETGERKSSGAMAYFAGGSPGTSPFFVRMTLYRIWQLSIVLLFAGIFFPRRCTAQKVPEDQVKVVR